MQGTKLTNAKNAAKLFQAAADAETLHALKEFEVAGMIKSTAENLKDVVNEVRQASELVGNITVASEEQSMQLDNANEGIVKVTDVVQSNSATAEECAAASEELSAQAESLNRIIDRFNLRS